MMSRGLVALALMVLGAGPLSGQDARLQGRLAPVTAARVEAIVDSSRLGGLPTEPLIRKALEGQAKGASGEQIVAAVTALAAGLRQAVGILGTRAPESDLIAAVLWLRNGGGDDRLMKIADAAEKQSLAVPLAVAVEWLARGWPSDEAAESLVKLLEARVTDIGFLTLRRAVETDLRRGKLLIPAIRGQVARHLTPAGPP